MPTPEADIVYVYEESVIVEETLTGADVVEYIDSTNKDAVVICENNEVTVIESFPTVNTGSIKEEIDVIETIEVGPQGKQGEKGDPGDTGPSGSYNFIEIISPTVLNTSQESFTLTVRTMRKSGVDEKIPTLKVNDVLVTPSVVSGDSTVYEYSHVYSLNPGENKFTIVSDNGGVLTKEFSMFREGSVPKCSLSFTNWMKAGTYQINLTTDYKLLSSPLLSASIGTLSPFIGSEKNWQANLFISSGQNGVGLFSNAILLGECGEGNEIISAINYNVDTVPPVIQSGRNFSRTLWHYENGAMSVTIPMGEDCTGFSGYINLSAFGLSASFGLSPSGNNMVGNFTPVRTNAGPAYGTNIRVYDRAGNAASNNGVDTENQLQVIAYRLTIQNITFPAFSATSNPLTGGKVFETDANSIVNWGAGQTATGRLYYGTDYTVVDHNKIKLDSTKWANNIAANSLGLLNVDVYEN